MRCTIIANPLAGRKGGVPTNSATAADAHAALAARGIRPDVVATTHPGHATELAREAARDGYDVVIAAGGDGTVREVAIGLLGTQAPLGIMPLGSVMNVARMLDIPRDLEGAAAVIAAGECAYLDVGRAGDHYFLEAAGVGLDALIFRYANQLDAGRWSALPQALRIALSYRPQRLALELDGWAVELPAMLVTIANGPYCGPGLPVAPEARVDDHRLDVRVFGPMSKLALLRRLAHPRHQGHEGHVYTFKARDVRVAAPRPLPGHADACSIGMTPLRFTLLPAALPVLVGPSVPARHHALAAAADPISTSLERMR